MKLSLMTINLSLPLLLDEQFRPREAPDKGAYEAILQHAQAAGFDAVDLSGGDLEAFGAETVAELLKKYRLKCASVIQFGSCTSTDPEVIAANAQSVEKLIDGCVTLGCKVLMLVAGWPAPGQSREEMFHGLCANLQKAVALAGDRVRVCVEDFPSTEIPMSASADVRRLLEAVPGLGLVYDSANMLTEGEDPIGYFHAFTDRIAYYHLKDVRITPEGGFGDRMRDGRYMVTTQHGRGVIDWKALGRMLGLIQYEGYLSVEYAQDPAIEGEPWAVIAAEKAYLEEALGLGKERETVSLSSHPAASDPSNANQNTRRYLDGIWFEERLLDAVLPDISCILFGERFSSPIMPAALSHLAAFSEGRETGMVEYARAAEEKNILNWVGMMENTQFQQILDTGARTVRIVKPYADREKLRDRLRYAAEHGAVAVGVDIDHAFDGRGGYDLVFGEQMAPLTALELRKLVESVAVPFVVKGVLSVTDARKCAASGVKGILVSHHHGRLPFALPPVSLLPEVKAALAGTGVHIFADCHIDSGYDAYKALALGADAVCVGRALLPALRKEGASGAVKSFTEMEEQLRGAMCYTGVGRLEEMDISVLRNY